MQTMILGVPRRPSAGTQSSRSVLPGLILTSALAVGAFALRDVSGITALSPLIIAILLGVAIRNTVGTPAALQPGVAFSMRRILRVGIILLGLQLSMAQVIAVGIAGLAIIAAALGSTFIFTVWLARHLSVERKLAELIAAGTSICGASAVVATNTVTRAPDEDVAYAVACVTVFGSASMLLYPTLAGILQLAPHAFGLWAGASIHEIAQVVAAAYHQGVGAGNYGLITKLSRVMLLAPLVLALGWFRARKARSTNMSGDNRTTPRAMPLPWFIAGFVAMMLFNSLDLIPSGDKVFIGHTTTFLLTIALAAMGLETDIRKLQAKGWRPLLLAAVSCLFISAFSLALIELAYA
jgi:uncharacterized integral membrane protein (TIGR00698 family)